MIDYEYFVKRLAKASVFYMGLNNADPLRLGASLRGSDYPIPQLQANQS